MSTDGDDSQPGSLESPFATMDQFMTVASPGDTLYIRGGVYFPDETFITGSGTPDAYITIRNFPGETPIFDGRRDQAGAAQERVNGLVIDDGAWSGIPGKRAYWIIDGLVFVNWWRGGFWFGGHSSSNTDPEYTVFHDIIIRNVIIDLCGQTAITMSNSDRVLIENTIVGRTGFDLSTGSWSSSLNIIDSSGKEHVFRNIAAYHGVDVSLNNTDGNGLILDAHGSDDEYNGAALVENALFFKNGGAGIAWTKQHNASLASS
jgi:hypothetical protein